MVFIFIQSSGFGLMSFFLHTFGALVPRGLEQAGGLKDTFKLVPNLVALKELRIG